MSRMLRGFAFVAVFLLMAAALAPTVQRGAVKAAQDQGFIEVTSEACGIQGCGSRTIQLTKAQYDELQRYLAGFHARLDNVTTREEAIPLYKEAIGELDRYHLLPPGMSPQQAERLVLLAQRLPLASERPRSSNVSENHVALIAGRLENIYFYSQVCIILNTLVVILYLISLFMGLGYRLFQILGSLLLFLYELDNTVSPVSFFDTIRAEGAYGWVYTIGLNGVKAWEGHIYGSAHHPIYGIYYPFVYGFTGLKLRLGDGHQYFFLGTALEVRGEVRQ